ncbi:MAG: response regulator [Anaerolineaceae bacterium]|jgi:CheY-like chemotaxis protein|nr:response regulator [Anaerolineaceae bacterium]MDD4043757.1 response regulator [Anaerolineaceae bacterium]MDD4578388.1 response regulator [Anaerolineaceae bacterium]
MKTILIVEDTEINIDLLTQLLEDDYKLLVARDGAESIAITERSKPDLILMDISLPVMDGYEAARQIRQRYSSLPIIGLSANAMKSDCEKAIAAGCTDYLTKPIDETVLMNKLREHLG